MKSIYVKLGSLVLAGVLLAGCASRGTVGAGASFKGPIGLQLYSLRGEFKKGDIDGTLAKVHAMGIKYVELAGTYDQSPEKFLTLLAKHDLVAISGHFGFDRFKNEPEKVAQEAKALGLKYAGCAWIPHQGDVFT